MKLLIHLYYFYFLILNFSINIDKGKSYVFKPSNFEQVCSTKSILDFTTIGQEISMKIFLKKFVKIKNLFLNKF